MGILSQLLAGRGLAFAAVLCGQLLLFLGCETTRLESNLEGNRVANPAIGYYGFEFQFPEDYRWVDTSGFSKDDETLEGMGHLVWTDVQTRYGREMGMRFEETFVFQTSRSAIAVTVANLHESEDFLRMDQAAQKRMMAYLCDRLQLPGEEILHESTAIVSGHPVAAISMAESYGEHDFAYEFRILPGTMVEVFIIAGFSLESHRDQLNTDLEDLIASLKVR